MKKSDRIYIERKARKVALWIKENLDLGIEESSNVEDELYFHIRDAVRYGRKK